MEQMRVIFMLEDGLTSSQRGFIVAEDLLLTMDGDNWYFFNISDHKRISNTVFIDAENNEKVLSMNVSTTSENIGAKLNELGPELSFADLFRNGIRMVDESRKVSAI